MAKFRIMVRGEDHGVASGPDNDDTLDWIIGSYLNANQFLKPEARIYREHIKIIPEPEHGELVN